MGQVPVSDEKAKKGTGGQNAAEYFRKAFVVRDRVRWARVYATCHGAYQLSINGTRPDDREFAPEFTVYSQYLCYQTYDITPLLQTGENVIGMLVGDGWYNCANFKPLSRKFKPEHAVLFQVKIEYEDGTNEMVVSDGGVTVSDSPVRSSDLFAGNFTTHGWNRKAGIARDLTTIHGKPASCQAMIPQIWSPSTGSRCARF